MIFAPIKAQQIAIIFCCAQMTGARAMENFRNFLSPQADSCFRIPQSTSCLASEADTRNDDRREAKLACCLFVCLLLVQARHQPRQRRKKLNKDDDDGAQQRGRAALEYEQLAAACIAHYYHRPISLRLADPV